MFICSRCSRSVPVLWGEKPFPWAQPKVFATPLSPGAPPQAPGYTVTCWHVLIALSPTQVLSARAVSSVYTCCEFWQCFITKLASRPSGEFHFCQNSNRGLSLFYKVTSFKVVPHFQPWVCPHLNAKFNRGQTSVSKTTHQPRSVPVFFVYSITSRSVSIFKLQGLTPFYAYWNPEIGRKVIWLNFLLKL